MKVDHRGRQLLRPCVVLPGRRLWRTGEERHHDERFANELPRAVGEDRQRRERRDRCDRGQHVVQPLRRGTGTTFPIAIDAHDPLVSGPVAHEPQRVRRRVDAAQERPGRDVRRERIQGVAEPRELFAREGPAATLGGEDGTHATGGCTTGSVWSACGTSSTLARVGRPMCS